LEQELVRAEAQSLVAEAQLTNVTRTKFREAYQVHLAAVLERSEKQALLAKQAQRLILLLDDTPVVPGEDHRPFQGNEEARVILNDAEAELRDWTPSWENQAAGVANGQQYHDAPTESGNISAAATTDGSTTAGSHFAGAGVGPTGEERHTGHHEGAVSVEDKVREEERVAVAA